jgi:hypothetical protein
MSTGDVKNVRNAKNKRQIETNLCINSCFYLAELTLCSESTSPSEYIRTPSGKP